MDVKIKTPSIFTYSPLTADPPGLSNVVATLCSHRSAFAEQYPAVGGRTPPEYYIKHWFVYNIILIVREIVLIVREIVLIVRCHLQRL